MNKLWTNITKIIWTQEGQIMLNQKVSNMHLCFNFSKLYWPNSSNFASNLIRLHSQNVIRQNNLQIEYLLRGKNTIWKEKVICFAWLLLFYWIQQEYLTERVPFDLLGCWQQEIIYVYRKGGPQCPFCLVLDILKPKLESRYYCESFVTETDMEEIQSQR